MTNTGIKVAALVVVCVGLLAHADPYWVVAERGKPATCAICVSDANNPVQCFAAEELRDHVRGMTDVNLPIVNAVPQGRAIVLSSDVFDDDGFSLKVTGDRLEVKGGRGAGVLFGVYELLETYGGCGWFSADSVDIPRLSAFRVPEGLDDRQKPAFCLRSTSWSPVIGSSSVVHAARCRLNGSRNTGGEARFGGSNPYRFDKVLDNCHTFRLLVPVKRYFKEHPEYFSEVGGRRVEKNTQLCLTNPDVLAIVISNVLMRIRANPSCRYFGVSQNDWQNPCCCASCKAIDDREGSHAGTVITFVNKVAEAVEKEFPNVVIETLAYQYSRKPPKTVRPRHNVMPCLCSFECDFSKPFGVSRYKENIAFERDILRWHEISPRLYVWDYTVNFKNYTHAFPNVETIGPNIRFFRDAGVSHLFEQGCGQAPHADFAELKAWLIGKFAWNPDRSLEPLLDRFFSGYYGPAAKVVREVHEAIYSCNRKRDERTYSLGIYEGVGCDWLSDGFYERIGEMWDRAFELVKDKQRYRDAVRWGRFGSDVTRVRRFLSTPSGGKICVSSHPERIDIVRRAEMQRIVRERILPMLRECPQVKFCEGSKHKNSAIERLLSDFASAETVNPVVTADLEETWGTISGGKRTLRGEVVDDPAAGNGRATKLNSGFGWSYYIPFTDGIGYDRGGKYRLRVRARIDRVEGEDGEALWTGVYNYDRKCPSTKSDLSVKASEMRDGYAWYDLGVFKPSPGDTIWAAAGRRRKDGGFAYGNLYIDKFELSVADKGRSRFERAPLDYVDPLIGTEGAGSQYGGMQPYTCVPFGSFHAVPMTRTNCIGRLSFNSADADLLGIILTRQPAIWMGDWGEVCVEVPPSKVERIDSTPYRTHVTAGGRTYEFTATAHAAWIRGLDAATVAAFPESGVNTNRMDAKYGYPLPHFGGRWFADKSRPDELKIGLSLISVEQARANLVNEIGSRTFGEVVAETKAQWEEMFSRIGIDAPDDVKTIFYTGLFHTLLYPRRMDEGGRYYSAFDDKIHTGIRYNCYSLWDTYRAEHPWLTLIVPERVDGMMQSLVDMYKEGGWLPKWPNPGYTGIMVGSPAEVVLADAYSKGFHSFDLDLAYEAVRKNAMVPQDGDEEETWEDRGTFGVTPETRGGLTSYMKRGYVACDRTAESVSRTQDFGLDDCAAAILAEATGHADDAAYFRARAKNYTNLWNAAAGQFLPRKADGTFMPSDTTVLGKRRGHPVKAYCEQKPETATWAIPYDTDGLVALLGGKEEAVRKLDEFFDCLFFKPDGRDGRSIHGNEPSHHCAYLYNRFGAPEKTQLRVHQILSRCYSTNRKGFEGNEDCGQMSAWYILSALGFYPLDPTSGEYEIGSPIVKSAELKFVAPYEEATLRIIVRNYELDRWRVKRVTLNGHELSNWRLRHADLVKGGELVFEMEN